MAEKDSFLWSVIKKFRPISFVRDAEEANSHAKYLYDETIVRNGQADASKYAALKQSEWIRWGAGQLNRVAVLSIYFAVPLSFIGLGVLPAMAITWPAIAFAFSGAIEKMGDAIANMYSAYNGAGPEENKNPLNLLKPLAYALPGLLLGSYFGNNFQILSEATERALDVFGFGGTLIQTIGNFIAAPISMLATAFSSQISGRVFGNAIDEVSGLTNISMAASRERAAQQQMQQNMAHEAEIAHSQSHNHMIANNHDVTGRAYSNVSDIYDGLTAEQAAALQNAMNTTPGYNGSSQIANLNAQRQYAMNAANQMEQNGGQNMPTSYNDQMMLAQQQAQQQNNTAAQMPHDRPMTPLEMAEYNRMLAAQQEGSYTPT